RRIKGSGTRAVAGIPSVLPDKPGNRRAFSFRRPIRTAMAKEELLEMNGVVVEVLPDARYRVTLDNGHNLVAYTAGKMRKHHIRIMGGERVSWEVSPSDRSKGRFTSRQIEERSPPPASPPPRR